MDKLDELTLLIAILDGGSLAAGARKTGRSAASVTRILGEMEERLGIRLVARTTRKLVATEAGRRLAEHGRRVLADYDESVLEAMGEAARPAGLLRISAPLMFGRRHIAPIVARFLAQHPQVDADLLLSNDVVDLVGEKIDVALRIGVLADSRLTVRSVGEVRRIVVASPDYLARCGTPGTPAALSQHALIMLSSRGEVQPWRFGGHAPFTQGRLTVNQAETMIDAAIAGIGLARPLSYQVAGELACGSLVRVLQHAEPDPIPVSLVYAGRKYLPLRTRAFLEFALGELKNGALPA